MKIRMLLWSGLSASVVMLAGGAALSGPPTPIDNRLLDYDQATRQLHGLPPSPANPAIYLHEPSTKHLLADLTKFAPPDPCYPLAEAWNLTVQYDQRYGVTSTFVFDTLLTIMSDFSCHAGVTSTGGTLNTIGPTSN